MRIPTVCRVTAHAAASYALGTTIRRHPFHPRTPGPRESRPAKRLRSTMHPIIHPIRTRATNPGNRHSS